MELSQLRCFYEVCLHKSFSKAAKELFITQQGVSKAVKVLETELNIQLLNRSPGGVSLTPQGEYLMERCQIIFNTLDETVKTLNTLSENDKNILNIGFSRGMMSLLPDDIISAFLEKSTEFSVNITDGFSPSSIDDFSEKNISTAFSWNIVDENKFYAVPLFDEKICAFLSSKNPLAKKKELTYADLLGQTLVFSADKPEESMAVKNKCKKNGIKPKNMLTAPDIISAYETCRKEDAIGFALEITKNKLTYENIKFLNFDNGLTTLPCYLLVRKDIPFTLVMKEFVLYIEERQSANNLQYKPKHLFLGK